MRVVTVIPAHLAVHAGEAFGRPAGVLTLVGSGEMSEIVIEVLLDPSMLGALEATTAETRVKLRSATAGV